jgi:hypothetical protein
MNRPVRLIFVAAIALLTATPALAGSPEDDRRFAPGIVGVGLIAMFCACTLVCVLAFITILVLAYRADRRRNNWP